MKEHHHTAVWDAPAARRRFEPHRGDMQADVAIVGAGITGLTAALLLKQAGRTVVVVDAHGVAGGTSGHTTAHLSAEYDHDYAGLQAAYGDDACRQVAASMLEAIALVERLVRTLGIDCAFRRLPGYYFAEQATGVDAIDREYETIARLDLYPVERVERVPLPFPTMRGCRIPEQAELHPTAYLHGLAAAVEGDGCRVFEHSPVIEYDAGPRPSIRTTEGQVAADQLIMATHTPLGRTALHTLVAAVRSYVVGFSTRSGAAPDGLFWDTANPYHYVRRHQTSNGPIVLVGGEDTRAGHGGEPEAFAALEAYARARFEVDRMHARWSAQFYEPADQLPLIGPMPGARDVYVGTGYSGDGMTFGTLAGRMLTEQILGRGTPYDTLYRPARTRAVRGGTQFLKENADAARRFVADRLGDSAGRAALDQLGAGTGAVLTVEGRHVAAARDDSGQLALFDAVCPHLGCIVHWNAAHKTFDCPCHGSRFASDGDVLEGPALSGLTRLDADTPGRRAP